MHHCARRVEETPAKAALALVGAQRKSTDELLLEQEIHRDCWYSDDHRGRSDQTVLSRERARKLGYRGSNRFFRTIEKHDAPPEEIVVQPGELQRAKRS